MLPPPTFFSEIYLCSSSFIFTAVLYTIEYINQSSLIHSHRMDNYVVSSFCYSKWSCISHLCVHTLLKCSEFWSFHVFLTILYLLCSAKHQTSIFGLSMLRVVPDNSDALSYLTLTVILQSRWQSRMMKSGDSDTKYLGSYVSSSTHRAQGFEKNHWTSWCLRFFLYKLEVIIIPFYVALWRRWSELCKTLRTVPST